MPQSLILGYDFLDTNQAKIDFSTQSLLIPEPDTDEKLIHSIELNAGLARTKRSVKIKPLHQVDIPVKVSNIRNNLALLEPMHNLPGLALAGAKCLVSLDDKGNTCMRILNPTKKPVHLPANYVVASVSPVESNSVADLANTKNSDSSNDEADNDELDFDLSESDLTDEQKDLLLAFLYRNRKVFAKDLTEIGLTNLYHHTIDTGDDPPIRKPFYRQSPPVLEEMNRQLDQMLKNDIIEESNSEWGAPVVMCRKKSGELRFACDFRSLNQKCRVKHFPLPRFEDVLDSLGKAQAQVLSVMDLFSGYWQCPLDPKTAHKSAFVTPSGVYQWKRNFKHFRIFLSIS